LHYQNHLGASDTANKISNIHLIDIGENIKQDPSWS